MDVFEAIKNRRSVRRYLSDPISDADLKRILDAARWAPSAGNRQPWEFVVVKDLERKRAIAKAALNQMFIAEAPVVLVVGANIERSASRYGSRGATLYCIQDTAAAIMNLMLAAHALGYGTCWIGAFDERKVAEIIGFPEHIRPVAIIPIGRPAERPSPPPRFALEEIVHIEKYGNKWTGV